MDLSEGKEKEKETEIALQERPWKGGEGPRTRTQGDYYNGWEDDRDMFGEGESDAEEKKEQQRREAEWNDWNEQQRREESEWNDWNDCEWWNGQWWKWWNGKWEPWEAWDQAGGKGPGGKGPVEREQAGGKGPGGKGPGMGDAEAEYYRSQGPFAHLWGGHGPGHKDEITITISHDRGYNKGKSAKGGENSNKGNHYEGKSSFPAPFAPLTERGSSSRTWSAAVGHEAGHDDAGDAADDDGAEGAPRRTNKKRKKQSFRKRSGREIEENRKQAMSAEEASSYSSPPASEFRYHPSTVPRSRSGRVKEGAKDMVVAWSWAQFKAWFAAVQGPDRRYALTEWAKSSRSPPDLEEEEEEETKEKKEESSR